MVPHAEFIDGDIFRIYFTARDKQNRGRTYSLLWDARRPLDVMELEMAPFLDIGELGAFDDSGAMLTWITDIGASEKLYYYIGWNLGVTVPFRNALGVAVVRDSQIVTRYPGPTMDRTLTEPHFIGSACILYSESRIFRNWYLSCVRWERQGDSVRHRYHIKYAESADGLHWQRDGRIAIDFAAPDEIAISRPCVLQDSDRYRMWYSCRSEQYRIGYAESKDGYQWERRDHEVGITVSDTGWDDRAVAYPYVFDHKGTRFMLYNGNAYGQTGFGIAVLE